MALIRQRSGTWQACVRGKGDEIASFNIKKEHRLGFDPLNLQWNKDRTNLLNH